MANFTLNELLTVEFFYLIISLQGTRQFHVDHTELVSSVSGIQITSYGRKV